MVGGGKELGVVRARFSDGVGRWGVMGDRVLLVGFGYEGVEREGEGKGGLFAWVWRAWAKCMGAGASERSFNRGTRHASIGLPVLVSLAC